MADGKPGRKKIIWEITAEVLAEVERLAGLLLTQAQIYKSFGLKKEIFYNKLKTCPELRRALDKGHCTTIAAVSNKVLEAALNGNLYAGIYLLKSRGAWSESNPIVESSEMAADAKNNEKVSFGTDAIEAVAIYRKVMQGQ